MVKLRDDDADEFRLSHGQNAGHPVLMVIQLLQCIGNDLLAFLRQGIRVVKISGYGCLGKIGISGNVVKGHSFFFLPYQALQSAEVMYQSALAQTEHTAGKTLKINARFLLGID